MTSLHLALLFLRNLLLQPVIRFVWGIMIDLLIGYTLFINGSTFWPFYGSCFYSFFHSVLLQVLRYTCAVPFHGHVFKEANLGQSSIEPALSNYLQLPLGISLERANTCSSASSLVPQFSSS